MPRFADGIMSKELPHYLDLREYIDWEPKREIYSGAGW
jgi:hypothetical protein